jgi:hypothetical protein
MSQYQPANRPSIHERFERFLSLKDLNTMIEDLEIAYAETQNEKVFSVLSKLKQTKQRVRSEEELYRDEEFREFWDNPGKWPYSVRVWIMHYKDKETS